ncbi:MAG: DHA2 family efflux MFS transporter permease subunit [Gammaproteobacteria bacterium]
MSDHSEPHIHRGAITVAVMLAALMQVIDMTIANVALPHMQGSFGVSLDDIKLVLTFFIVASAVATPAMGWLAERYGRRRVLLVCVTGFAVFSFMVGASTSFPEVVTARALQGVFGSAFVPLAQAILLDTYPRERHGTAMAIFTLGVVVGPVLGPTIGGYITQYYSWRWNFFINVPLGLITLLMVWNFVPRQLRDKTRSFDMLGFIILGLGIGALQYMLDRGNAKNWFASPEIVACAVTAFVLLWIYPWYASLKKQPFVSLRLFRDRNYTLGAILMLLLGVVLLATVSLLPPFMQDLLNFPVFETGLILAPRGLGAMLAAILVGRLINRIDPRLFIFTGILINVFALYELSQMTLQVDPWFIVWTGFLQGLGLGQVFVPLQTVAFSTLPANLRNEGTPIFNLIRNIGSSIGISVVFTLLSRNTQINHAALAEKFTVFGDRLTRFLHAVPLPRDTALVMLNGEITRQATMISYNNDFLLMSAMMLLMVPLPLLMTYHYGNAMPGEKTAAAME